MSSVVVGVAVCRCSSAVEHLICNQAVVGSNPTIGSALLGILACALVGVRVGIRMLNSLKRISDRLLPCHSLRVVPKPSERKNYAEFLSMTGDVERHIVGPLAQSVRAADS